MIATHSTRRHHRPGSRPSGKRSSSTMIAANRPTQVQSFSHLAHSAASSGTFRPASYWASRPSGRVSPVIAAAITHNAQAVRLRGRRSTRKAPISANQIGSIENTSCPARLGLAISGPVAFSGMPATPATSSSPVAPTKTVAATGLRRACVVTALRSKDCAGQPRHWHAPVAAPAGRRPPGRQMSSPGRPGRAPARRTGRPPHRRRTGIG